MTNPEHSAGRSEGLGVSPGPEIQPDLPAPGTTSRLGRQFGWISGGRIVAALLQALTLVLLARWTSLDDFGLLSSYLSVVVITQTATDMGVPTLICRQRAADPTDSNICWALRWNSLTSVAIAVILGLVTVVAGCVVSLSFFALLPLTIWAAAERNTDAWLGLALADGDARINTASLITRRVGAFAGLWGLHAAGWSALLAYSAANCVVSVVANVWVRRIMARRLPAARRTVGFRTLVRLAAPYWVNSLATQARTADVIIVGLLAGPVQAALYAAASRTTSPLRILPTSLATVLVPAAARASSGGGRNLKKPVLAVLVVVCVIYGSIVLLAPEFVPRLLGDSYRQAVLPLQIVVAGLVFAALSSMFGAYLQGAGQARATARAAFLSTAVCLIGVGVGVHLSGAVGAATALSASFVLQSGLLGFSLWRIRNSGTESPSALRRRHRKFVVGRHG